MAPVDDLVEGAAVGMGDRLEGPVGRTAQGQDVGADPVPGYAEYAPAGLRVADGRVASTDAQVGGGQHHRHGRLAQIFHACRDRVMPSASRLLLEAAPEVLKLRTEVEELASVLKELSSD